MLVLDDLLGGGAARVATILANNWSLSGHIVTLITNDDGMYQPHYHINNNVQHIPLSLRSNSKTFSDGLKNNVFRILKIRKTILKIKPDIVISFLDGNNVLCLIAIKPFSNIPVVICERTDPHGRNIGKLWGVLRSITYPWANCLVTQTDHALSYFSKKIQSIGKVIPNPVIAISQKPQALSNKLTSRRFLISLGSLRYVKGHDMLIKAFSQIANSFPNWDLYIYGEGPERNSLTRMICELGLPDRVFLPGHVSDPMEKLQLSDIFVLSSRAEGFPNALAEAMSCGLPVISFDCKSGPSELIRSGYDGILVPAENISALADSMANLMASPEERLRLSVHARDVISRFDLKKIIGSWEDVMNNFIGY